MPNGDETIVPSALPSRRARALAVVSILVGGACGALIGYAFIDMQCDADCTVWNGLGLVGGGLFAAAGIAVVAVLTLRAMDEWQTTARRARDRLEVAPKGHDPSADR